MSQECLVCGKELNMLLHYCSDRESDHDGIGCAFCYKSICWACVEKEEAAHKPPRTMEKFDYLEGVLYLGAPCRLRECERCGIKMCESCLGEAFGSCKYHFSREMYSYVGGFGPRTIEVQQAEAREAAVVHYWETRQGWKALSEFMETLKHFIRETGSILLYLYGTQATPGSHMLDPSFFQGPYRLIEETEYLDRPVSVFDDLMQARGRSSIGLPVVTRLYLARLHYHVDKIYKIIKTGRFQFAIETRHDRANVVGVENETGTLLKLAEKALNVLKRPRID